MTDYQRTIQLAKSQILEDVKSHKVPLDVENFVELQNYVDANEYGGVDFIAMVEAVGEEDACEFLNEVQDELNTWIESGYMKRELAGDGVSCS